MRAVHRFAAATAFAVGLLGPLAAPAFATPAGHFHGPERTRPAVFVQTDNTAGNQVVVYDRASDGTLSPAGTYQTGGLGGVLNGSAVDHLASQGSLTYDARQHALYAVNAGSNTVSVFGVYGDRLFLRQVVSSRGIFPVSVAVHGDLVYVLNALGNGSVAGFRSFFGRLFPIIGSVRSLGLTIPTDATQFTHTPGQVAFSPDGRKVLVTTKAASNAVDVFSVGFGGWLSPSPTVNSLPGTVPFAGSFDAAGHYFVTEAGTNSLASFTLDADGTITPIDSVGTGQIATCWVAPAHGYLFASNAGSGSVSGISPAADGHLGLIGATATDPGTVDASASADGQFLYVQAGKNGNVDEFHVNAGGTLTSVGSVTVPGAAGGEGIVAI